jgi:hypothetical protein
MRGALFAPLACTSPLVALTAPPLISPSAGSDAVLAIRNAPETVSVGIAGDYHYIRSAELLSISDYRLRRIFSVQHGDAFVNN